MAQPEKPDARDIAIYANDLYAVGPHRKIKSANSLIAVTHEHLNEQYPTFLSMIESEDGVQNLKKMFNAIATGAHNNGANSEIFWLVNATDDRITDKNLTYSQGSYPHAHIIHGPLPENFKYGYILKEKTYTPSPRFDFKEGLQDLIASRGVIGTSHSNAVLVVPPDLAVSPLHMVIMMTKYLNFTHFNAHATDADYKALNDMICGQLRSMMPEGGARLVCDDFNSPGILTLHVQSGDQKHKWFERLQPSL